MNLPGMLLSAIALFMLGLAGGILAIAGTVFNWVVIRTVYQFGTYFGTSEGMLTAWGIMRDIANIGLLFGFILMGVLLILNVEGGGHGHGGGMSAKKAIPRLILFAVLLNFSLFASQAIIDVANAFSSTFATLAGQQCDDAATDGKNDEGKQSEETCANVGISGQIIEVTGMSKIFQSIEEKNNIGHSIATKAYSTPIMLIMLTIFVLITAMVLLAGAIMLIIRVVILSLLMVTAPIGFAGMAIPKLSGLASQWWSKLLSQSFFAPVYLLLIFISIKLSEGLMQGDATIADALMGNQGANAAGNMQVIMVYMIVTGFMIASLVAASKMGAMGAKFATSTAAGLTVGAVGFAGRRTVGVASGKVANRIASSQWARSNGFGSQLALKTFNKGASSSMSARTAINSAMKGAGVDIGMGNASKNVAHGIHGIEEAEIKKRVDFSEKGLRRTEEEIKKEEALKNEKIKLQNSKAYEQTQRKRIEAEEEAAMRKAQSENEQNMKLRLAQIEVQKGRVAGAEFTKDTDPEALLSEKRDLDQLLRDHETESKAAAQDIESRKAAAENTKAAHQENMSRFDTRTREIDREIKGGSYFNAETGTTDKYAGVSADAVKRQYAENMAHQKVPIPFSVGTHINHEASEKILKKLNRSQNEKLIDAIKETAKEEKDASDDHDKKDDHGGGGDSHAPKAGGHGADHH